MQAMSTLPRQFQTAAQRRTFFDRKVLNYGASRTLAVGKVIPKEWTYVRITPIEQTEDSVTIKIERMWGKKDDTRRTPTRKTNRQDT